MLLVNGREIPVAVVRSRRARRYILRLRDDGLARLTIPRNGSAHEAWEFVQRQGAWLERQLQHLASRPVRSKEWRVGTEIFFRGERIKIEIIPGSQLAIDPPLDVSNSAAFQIGWAPNVVRSAGLETRDWLARSRSLGPSGLAFASPKQSLSQFPKLLE